MDARDNSHIWGEQYSRKAADIFALQGNLAMEMTTALRMRLTGEDEKRMEKSYTANPAAYQDYLQGRYWFNKSTEEGFRKGIEYFEQAIAKDPNYALAYAGLADCHANLATFVLVPPKEGYSSAREAALKALELDDTLPEAHAVLGGIKANYEWDWSGGEREFQRAIALNPNDVNAHLLYVVALWGMGRLESATAELKQALEIDPLSIRANMVWGFNFYFARQYEQTIGPEQKALELDPNFIPGHVVLCLAYLQQSKYQQGIAEVGKAVAAFPDSTDALSVLGYAYAVAGRRTDAQSVLDKLNAFSKQRYVPPGSTAMIYAALGEKDQAFEWLEKAYEDRSILDVGPFAFVKLQPAFDPLRSDPRFTDLLRRMNLQP